MGLIGGGTHQNLVWNYTEAEIIDRKGINKGFFKDVGKALIRWYEPYVPKDKGNLRKYVQAHPAKDHVTLTYQVNHAQRQYTGDGSAIAGAPDQPYMWRRTTLGTTSYWDYYCWTINGRDMMAEIEAIREAHSHDD